MILELLGVSFLLGLGITAAALAAITAADTLRRTGRPAVSQPAAVPSLGSRPVTSARRAAGSSPGHPRAA